MKALDRQVMSTDKRRNRPNQNKSEIGMNWDFMNADLEDVKLPGVSEGDKLKDKYLQSFIQGK